MTILVDSDWIIDCLAGVPSALGALATLQDQGLAISTITIGEVLEGAHGKRGSAEKLVRYRRFLQQFIAVPVSDDAGESFAWLRALLRDQGNLISDLDLLIAATALSHDLTLLTRNLRDFERIPGLKIYRSENGLPEMRS